jgi:hypothetical protein
MAKIKRGTRIEYTYAAGKVVQGKILGPYCLEMPGWYRARLWDEGGEYVAGIHENQIRVVSNNAEAR